MMNTNTKPQELDEATKARAEQTARVLASIPPEKELFFLAIANAYLDGLITGQNLKGSTRR